MSRAKRWEKVGQEGKAREEEEEEEEEGMEAHRVGNVEEEAASQDQGVSSTDIKGSSVKLGQVAPEETCEKLRSRSRQDETTKEEGTEREHGARDRGKTSRWSRCCFSQSWKFAVPFLTATAPPLAE
eukprot:762749-Hanusia_phi.AAC.2